MASRNIETEVEGPEFLLGILPYDGKKYHQCSGKKYFVHLRDYLGGLVDSEENRLTVENMTDFVRRLKREEIPFDHCHALVEAREFPPDRPDYQDNILYAGGGIVIYKPEEIRLRGLLAALNASLLSEVLTQIDLMRDEMADTD
jgi:hypothetical protein